MNQYSSNTPTEGNYQSIPSYKDIFKHAWGVLWENPRQVILFALFLAFAQLIFDMISNALMAPYIKDFENFAKAAGLDQPGAQEELMAAISVKGSSRLFMAFLVSFLSTPFLGFCLAKGALSIWDGIYPEPRDIGEAIFNYPKCLLFFLLLCFYAFVLSCITVLMATPAMMFGKIVSGPGTLFIMLIVLAATVYIWCKFIWPYVRRFLFLQFFAFFFLSDHPGGTDFLKKTWEIHEDLKLFPTHLNFMALYTFLAIFAVLIPVGILQELFVFISQDQVFTIVCKFIVQFVLFFGVLWPSLAIAGFYRLCLCPPEDLPPTPQYSNEG